jgi:hypothetical protein
VDRGATSRLCDRNVGAMAVAKWPRGRGYTTSFRFRQFLLEGNGNFRQR